MNNTKNKNKGSKAINDGAVGSVVALGVVTRCSLCFYYWLEFEI
jgi:hypothetical protein